METLEVNFVDVYKYGRVYAFVKLTNKERKFDRGDVLLNAYNFLSPRIIFISVFRGLCLKHFKISQLLTSTALQAPRYFYVTFDTKFHAS